MRMSIFAESQIRVGGPENPSELITTRENLGGYFDLTKIPSLPARAVDGKNLNIKNGMLRDFKGRIIAN